MIRGLYSAASGMMAQQNVQDALAGNIANISTIGFKQDVPTFRALQEMALRRYENGHSTGGVIGELGTGAKFDRSVTDLSEGQLTATGNPYDLALVGSGFFAMQTPQGEQYTRAGQFHLEPSGKDAFLSDDKGNRVLGAKGPINLAGAKEVTIDAQGTVFKDSVMVDKLKVVNASASALVKQGGNMFSIQGTPMPSTASVRQAYIEQSNVNAIGAMVQMITVQRAYEAASKAITAQDESLGKIVNDVPRV